MSSNFRSTAFPFYLPALVGLSFLWACPLLSAQTTAVSNATSVDQADAHCALANKFATKYQWETAIVEYEAAYAYDKTARPKVAAVELNNIGVIYGNLSQHDKALTYYQKALPIRKQVGDRHGEAITLSSMGAEYNDLKQYKKALELFQQALAIRKQIGDRRGEATTLSNIGIAYEHQRQYDKALEYYQQALTIQRR